MKLKFTNPILPIGEIKITDEFSKTPPHLEKLKKCMDFYRANGYFDRQIIVDSDKTLHDGYCAYLTAYLLDVEEVKVLMGGERAEPIKEAPHAKPEPVKLYCVKSCDESLIKGTVYDISDGFLHYSDGLKAEMRWYISNRQLFKSSWLQGYLVPLVRRPAKVGEWVYVLDRGTSRYEEKQIYKVFDTGSDSCVWFAEDFKGNIRKENYLFLSGYTGDPA